MSEKIKSGIIVIIDDPKKRKKSLVALIVLLAIIIGIARYASQENPDTGVVVHTGNTTGQVLETAELNSTPEVSENMDIGIESISDETAAPVAIFVDVGGAVLRTGVIALPPGSRITDAIEAAGGLTENADISVINRAQIVADGDKIYIPTETEVENGHIKPSVGLVTGTGFGTSINNQYQGTASSGNAPGTDAQGRININSADSDTLQLLSGVGPATAQKIINYRNSNGQFKRVEDIMNVSGIGQKTFEKLKNEICV